MSRCSLMHKVMLGVCCVYDHLRLCYLDTERARILRMHALMLKHLQFHCRSDPKLRFAARTVNPTDAGAMEAKAKITP